MSSGAVNGANVPALLTQMRARREFWVDLPDPAHPGLAVQLRRPADGELGPFLRREGGTVFINADRAAVESRAVAWRGFTEAVLLGPAIGASDAVPFHADLWAELLLEHPDWMVECRQRLIDAIERELSQRAADAKN